MKKLKNSWWYKLWDENWANLPTNVGQVRHLSDTIVVLCGPGDLICDIPVILDKPKLPIKTYWILFFSIKQQKHLFGNFAHLLGKFAISISMCWVILPGLKKTCGVNSPRLETICGVDYPSQFVLEDQIFKGRGIQQIYEG